MGFSGARGDGGPRWVLRELGGSGFSGILKERRDTAGAGWGNLAGS